ncbi:MAG: hypothetical protein K0R24_1597 [Gammaproteobacteria bacterium]|jgi:hypothetical protein|nr:hypothetical protein [Gammaproteobacteria bacterium]
MRKFSVENHDSQFVQVLLAQIELVPQCHHLIGRSVSGDIKVRKGAAVSR